MSDLAKTALRKFAFNLITHWVILWIAFRITGDALTWPVILLCGTFTAIVATAINMIDHWPKKKRRQ